MPCRGLTTLFCLLSLHRSRARTLSCLWGLAAGLAATRVNGTRLVLVVKLGGGVPRGTLPHFCFGYFIV